MTGPAGFAAEQLKSFVERIERLEEEIATLNDDKKDIYAEAKGMGFDVKVLKEVIKIRRQDKAEREEMEAVLDLYLQALGMSFGRGGVDDEHDVTVQVVTDGEASISLGLLNKVVDGSKSAAGRAVISAALDAVKRPLVDEAASELGFV